MKVAIYLTVCVFNTVHCVLDQTWNAITTVDDRVDELEKRFDEMVNRIDQLQRENSELRNTINELGAEASSSPLISFTAIMTSGYFVPGGENIVPFDEAISNPGGHYNVTTYRFTCPSDGTYYFTFSLYSQSLQVGTDYDLCGGRLVMDGLTIVEALGIHYDATIGEVKQVSNSAVVFCTENSEVYVTAPFTNTGINGISSRTAFAGFIL